MGQYLHFKGKQIGKVNLMEDRTADVDVWLPSQAPTTATKVLTVDLSDTEHKVFDTIYEVKIQVLPMPVEAKVHAWFQGSVDVYKD